MCIHAADARGVAKSSARANNWKVLLALATHGNASLAALRSARQPSVTPHSRLPTPSAAIKLWVPFAALAVAVLIEGIRRQAKTREIRLHE